MLKAKVTKYSKFITFQLFYYLCSRCCLCQLCLYGDEPTVSLSGDVQGYRIGSWKLAVVGLFTLEISNYYKLGLD